MNRRIRLDLLTPTELAIVKAVDEVEKLPADTRLTNAVILLGKARDLVADFVDGIAQTEANPISDEQIEAIAELYEVLRKTTLQLRTWNGQRIWNEQDAEAMQLANATLEKYKAIRDKAANPLHKDSVHIETPYGLMNVTPPPINAWSGNSTDPSPNK